MLYNILHDLLHKISTNMICNISYNIWYHILHNTLYTIFYSISYDLLYNILYNIFYNILYNLLNSISYNILHMRWRPMGFQQWLLHSNGIEHTSGSWPEARQVIYWHGQSSLSPCRARQSPFVIPVSVAALTHNIIRMLVIRQHPSPSI